MPQWRTVYLNMIVDIGFVPGEQMCFDPESEPITPNPKIIKVVREALDKLTEKERNFIERYYFKGESLQEIAKSTKLNKTRLTAIHLRAIRKLRKYLDPFVQQEFGITTEHDHICPICMSPHLKEINRVIGNKRKEETWKNIIKILKTEFNLQIKSPQILIGHQKYHIQKSGGFYERQNTS